MASAFRCPKQT